ncbi:MAG TPA: single-stranded-DNA-specific exonuclease RecJ [Trueperaceae bacterium]
MIEAAPLVARPRTEWLVRPPAPPDQVERLVRELGVPPLLASMLWHRGIREGAAEQLSPPLRPSAITTLERAAERLELALRQRRRILIHGDYDADGVSGTAVLLLGLRSLGANVSAFIPNRLTDGYGVHPERVEEHAEACDLFITVDCGITNLAEVARLRELGVEVIVTDHHQPGDELPDCLVVHPSLAPGRAPGVAELTGAGVAYHLLWTLHRRLGLEDPLEYTDIATIGTVADVAPLLGENRALVKAGLERIASSNWAGLRSSVAMSGIRDRVTARDVAFVLAPRLNAAGRLGEADKALELLTTGSERRARELASYLDARNQDRRKIQDRMYAEALEKVDGDAPALVLDEDGWHPGVMGIVASKLLERFYKPVYIVAAGKGSVRSTPGISAVQGLRSAARFLKRFGGHEQAAGFAIDPEELPAFREAILEFVSRHPAPLPAISADAVVSACDVDADLYRSICELEPFGEGHPAPLLALCDKLEHAKAVGRERGTLQLRIAGLRGVAWRQGDLAETLRVGAPVNAAISVREREWQGKRQLEFVAEEIRTLERFGLHPNVDRSLVGSTGEVRRGSPPPGTGLASLTDPPVAGSVYRLRELPPGSERAPTSRLREMLAAGATVYLDFDEPALRRARESAEQLPTVADVRRGFVALQRGSALPYGKEKADTVRLALSELELLDSLGRVRRGEKRDPHSSPTLVNALIERYRLISLLNAYISFDDEAFSFAAAVLLAPSGSAEEQRSPERAVQY